MTELKLKEFDTPYRGDVRCLITHGHGTAETQSSWDGERNSVNIQARAWHLKQHHLKVPIITSDEQEFLDRLNA